jgi:hypothetical protein
MGKRIMQELKQKSKEQRIHKERRESGGINGSEFLAAY